MPAFHSNLLTYLKLPLHFHARIAELWVKFVSDLLSRQALKQRFPQTTKRFLNKKNPTSKTGGSVLKMQLGESQPGMKEEIRKYYFYHAKFLMQLMPYLVLLETRRQEKE